MAQILAACVLLSTPVAEGKATRYDPGLMEQVVENRVRWGQLDLSRPHDGYVALQHCCYLDDLVWLRWPTGEVSGPHLVADCGAEHDQDYLDAIGFGVDLSWPLAARYGVVDNVREGVRIYDKPPRTDFRRKWR